MWDGIFSPDLTKGLSPRDVVFDPENTDNLDLDPDWIEGTLKVKLGGVWYSWSGITYQQYLDFEYSGFSRSWLNENLPISYVGGWGWQFGRDHSSVRFIPDDPANPNGPGHWVTLRPKA